MKRWTISLLIFLFSFSFLNGILLPVPAQASTLAETETEGGSISAEAENPSLYLQSADDEDEDEEDEDDKEDACDIGLSDMFNIPKILLCVVGQVMGAVTAGGIAIGTAIIEYGIELNSTINDENSIARLGFDISLQLTNILFVVAIVVIAFLIMLRRGGGALLPKLILVALFINFSFFFATKLVELSDGLTMVFIDTATDGGWDAMTDRFTSLVVKDPNSSGIQDTVKNAIKGSFLNIVTMIFIVVFGLVSFITFLTLGIMFIIRYLYLSILLVLLPFALIGMAFPNTGKWWQSWLAQYTRWILFGPAIGFFIYLSFALLDSRYQPEVSSSLGSIAGQLVVLGMLVGGMIAANSLGVTGAGAALGYMKQGQAWATNKAKLAAMRSARWTERKALTLGAKPEEGRAALAARAGKRLAETPVLRSIGGLAAAGAIDRRMGGLKGDAEDRQGRKLSHLSDDILIARANATGTTFADVTTKAALAGELAKRGLTEKISPEKYQAFADAAAKMGMTAAVFETRPDLAANFKKDIATQTRKVGDIANISEKALLNREVIGAMTSGQIEDFGKKANSFKKNLLYTNLNANVMGDESMKTVFEGQRELKKLDALIKDESTKQSLLKSKFDTVSAAEGARSVKAQGFARELEKKADDIAKLIDQKNALAKDVGAKMDAFSATEKGLIKNYGAVVESPHFTKSLIASAGAPPTKTSSSPAPLSAADKEKLGRDMLNNISNLQPPL